MRALVTFGIMAMVGVVPVFAYDGNGVPMPGSDVSSPRTVNRSGDAPGSLTTLFATDNQFAGNTFDLLPAIDLLWTGTDFNLGGTGGTETMEVYTRVGTSVGFESNPAGWTTLGQEVVTVAGTNVPSTSTIGTGTVLTASALVGCYVDMFSYSGANNVLYTNGGPTTFSNADLSLTTFTGKGNPAFLGPTFSPRQWNGTIHYDDVVPVELMQFEIE